MKNNNPFFFVVFIFGFASNSFAQDQQPTAYVILTIEDTYKISQHGTRTYFWIIPVDSIKSYNTTVSRVFISGFTRSNLEDCSSHKPFDPLVYDQNPSLAFDPHYLASLEDSKQVVLKRRNGFRKLIRNGN